MSEAVTVPKAFAENEVIDTDVHLSPRTLIETEGPAYLDEPYRTRAKRSPVEKDGWDRVLGDKIDHRQLVDPESIQDELCEGFDVDIPIINPGLHLQRVPETDVAIHLMRALNDILLDKFLDDFDHFYGLAALELRDPQAAADELDRVGGDPSIVGALMVPTGRSPPLGHPTYDVVYDAAAANDLAIAYHATAGAFHMDFPIHAQGFERFASVHAMSHIWSQTETMTSVLANGITEKFPELDLAFLEAGVSWIPMMMFRLNKEFSIRKEEVPLAKRSPEEYIREFYFSSQPLGEPASPRHLAQILDMIDAPDTLMFASDYPHWDFDSPAELSKYLDSDETAERILHGNAAAAFGL